MRYKLTSVLAFILFLALSVQAQLPSQAADILIKNAKILDGTGNSWFYGDIAIGGGKIIQIGKLSNWNAKKVIDATGLVAAPGFIDVHTHIEGDEVKNPEATNFIYDGVTTVITGNCGSSDANIGRYLRKIDSLQTSVNVAVLVGHNDVRKKVMGRASRNPKKQKCKPWKILLTKQCVMEPLGCLQDLFIFRERILPPKKLCDWQKWRQNIMAFTHRICVTKEIV